MMKKNQEKKNVRNLKKKNDDINNFLFSKELIKEQKININDNYSIKYQKYKNRIDNILYKKSLDEEVLNRIKFMTSFDPALSGLGQNFYNMY